MIPTPIYEQDSFGRNSRQAVTQAWNVAVEQQLSNVMAMRVAYVGSQSYHQGYIQDDNFHGTAIALTTTIQNARSQCKRTLKPSRLSWLNPVFQLHPNSGIR